jgi:hypothetical protein
MVVVHVVAGGAPVPDLSLAMLPGGVGLHVALQPTWIGTAMVRRRGFRSCAGAIGRRRPVAARRDLDASRSSRMASPVYVSRLMMHMGPSIGPMRRYTYGGRARRQRVAGPRLIVEG